MVDAAGAIVVDQLQCATVRWITQLNDKTGNKIKILTHIVHDNLIGVLAGIHTSASCIAHAIGHVASAGVAREVLVHHIAHITVIIDHVVIIICRSISAAVVVLVLVVVAPIVVPIVVPVVVVIVPAPEVIIPMEIVIPFPIIIVVDCDKLHAK